MFSMNVWKTRHYTSDHGGQLTANSKSLVQRQRRTDDQVSWVDNAAQEVGDDASRCLLAMSEAGVTQSVRYCGALCCWHRCTPEMTCKTGQMYVRACTCPCDVNIFKTLGLWDCWAEVDETWQIYSVGRWTKLRESEILNFSRCT